MLLCHILLGFFWFSQGPKVSNSHHPAAAKVVVKASAVPKGPKTQAELEHDLAAALHAAPLTGDQVSLSVVGKEITLSGEVHAAEDKGVATRLVRHIAAKDGWTGVHVNNHLAVALPSQG